MIYQVLLQPQFKSDIKRHQKAGDKKLISKIAQLLSELSNNPRSGTGKPERLKGYTCHEMWSRRIDQKHRLVYEIKDDELIVIAVSTYGHYDDK